MNQSTPTGTSIGDSLTEIVGVVTQPQTYRNLLYLLLAFPLGIIYYVILMVGFTLGIGLSVLAVGLAILVGVVVGVRFIASFERRLANALLGTAIATPDDVQADGEGMLGTVKAYLTAASTWRGLGFVVLKFPIGILSFVLLVSLLGTAVELLLAPVFPEGVLNVEVANWEVANSVTTLTHRAIAVPGGAVLALVGLHILNAFARANASIASSLLGPEGSDTGEHGPD